MVFKIIEELTLMVVHHKTPSMVSNIAWALLKHPRETVQLLYRVCWRHRLSEDMGVFFFCSFWQVHYETLYTRLPSPSGGTPSNSSARLWKYCFHSRRLERDRSKDEAYHDATINRINNGVMREYEGTLQTFVIDVVAISRQTRHTVVTTLEKCKNKIRLSFFVKWKHS